MKSYQKAGGGCLWTNLGLFGGLWHERSQEPPRQHLARENIEKKRGGERAREKKTKGEYFSEHRWQSALREMARGDEKGWGRWVRRVVAFQRRRGVRGPLQAATSHTCRAWRRSRPVCRVTVVTVTSPRGQAGLTPLAHLPLQSEHRQPRAPFTSGGSSRFKNDGEKMEVKPAWKVPEKCNTHFYILYYII